jgi:hypothetical protein
MQIANNRKYVWALAVFFMIPVIVVAGGTLVVAIDPEKLAGHSHYVRNYHLLQLARSALMLLVLVAAGVAWLVTCLLVVMSKSRSYRWLLLAPLGPFGLAVLASLRDMAPEPVGLYERFIRRLNRFVRAVYEIGFFILVFNVAWEMMLLKREGIIAYQSMVTGLSTAQILDQQNASSGMWAFSELNEVMFFLALLYLLRPAVVNVAGSLFRQRGSGALPIT